MEQAPLSIAPIMRRRPILPGEGTAKHAASDCCPLMSGAVALLPPAALEDASSVRRPAGASAASLAGRLFTKDPPPPRV